jgi:hypothetical protein
MYDMSTVAFFVQLRVHPHTTRIAVFLYSSMHQGWGRCNVQLDCCWKRHAVNQDKLRSLALGQNMHCHIRSVHIGAVELVLLPIQLSNVAKGTYIVHTVLGSQHRETTLIHYKTHSLGNLMRVTCEGVKLVRIEALYNVITHNSSTISGGMRS